MNRKSKTKKNLAAGALVVGIATVGSLTAGAAPISIPVVNFGFETAASTGTGDFPGFTMSGTGYGYERSTDSSVLAPQGSSLAEISSYPFGVVRNETLSQSISLATYTPKVGDIITLTVAGETSQGAAFGGVSPFTGIELTLNGVQVVATTTPYPTYNFNSVGQQTLIDQTITYTVTSDTAGQTLGIGLLTTNTQGLFDNVRLSVEAASVPEPSTWALLFGGILALAGLRKARRQA